jgi:hypothetical protein
MKKFLLFAIALIGVSGIYAQSHLHLKSGKTFSTFFFKDSESVKEKNLNYVARNYFGISYDAHIGNRSIFRPEVGFRESGATTIIDNTKYKWDFSYLDLNLSYLFKALGNEKYGVYAGVGPNLGFLLMGEQAIGNDYFDVKKERAIKTVDFGVNFLVNSKIKVAENIFVTLEYRYAFGLLNIETDGANPDQITRNRAHGVLAGLSFNLTKSTENAEK